MKRIFLLLSLLAVQTVASATMLLYRSFPQVAQFSDAILIATVKDIRSVDHKELGIYTYVTFSDLDLLDGEYGENNLTVRLEGGRVDERLSYIPGTTRFAPSERVVLFVQGNGSKSMPFVGWQQGVFRIRKDEATGAEVVTDHHGNRIFGIKEGDLIKEARYTSDAEIVDDKAEEPPKQYEGLPPMDPEQFIGLVKEQIEIKRQHGIEPRKLVSVSPADPLPERKVSPLKTADIKSAD